MYQMCERCHRRTELNYVRRCDAYLCEPCEETEPFIDGDSPETFSEEDAF
jgi:hypothetical protein